MAENTLQRLAGKIKMFFRQKILANKTFPGVAEYWERRYAAGGTSGAGSYGELARYKADFLNEFVAQYDIHSVIEFGCGDGNQLGLAKYPRYLGLDISANAIRRCIESFHDDTSKSFYVYHSLAFSDNERLFKADLSLSLDVIFHLVDEAVYEAYLRHLFGAADKYVIVYSSNKELPQQFHEKHRVFVDWVKDNIDGFELVEVLPNKFQYNVHDPSRTSHSDFYVFQKQA